MNFPDVSGFAFSFSHAVIKTDDRQWTCVDGVKISQDLNDAPVYGTSRAPVKRSAGQLQMGQGSLRFSDFEEATDFFRSLKPDPFMKLWTLDYTLVNEIGTVRSIECRACRLVSVSFDHQAGVEAVGGEFPFSFLSMRIDGADVILSPAGIAQALIGVAQNLVNLL
jgi:hypothetical protein